MNDKCMPAGEQSAPSAQETDRRQDEPLTKVENSSGLSIGYDQPVPGTSAVQNRQGYCSCCQVLYNSLEQHILSTRHRDFVSNSRNNVSANSLMERFLQDVIQHHPYRYNDSRSLLSLLDLPATNSFVFYKECTRENISRRDFILKLATALRQKHFDQKIAKQQAAAAQHGFSATT